MKIGKYRVGIIVLILMLILQIAAPSMLKFADKASKYSLLLDNEFRMNTSIDKTVLDAFIYHVKNKGGYKIVFIGDSVIQGASVQSNSNTIPAFFENLVNDEYPDKDIKVYNFSLQGNRSSDIYFIMKKIIENNAADLIITNINYAFYSKELLEDLTIARPELFSDVMDSDSAKRLGLKFSSMENALTTNIMNRWNVYASREEMSFFLFGSNPRKFLYDGFRNFRKSKNFNTNYNSLAAPITPRKGLDKTWIDNKPFTEEKIKHWVEVFHVEDFNDNNIGFHFLKETAKISEDNDVKLITFLTPMNGAMIKELDLMRYGGNFQSNLNLIKKELGSRKIPIYDYTNTIYSDEFNDLFHMIASGNKHTSDILFRDTYEILKKEVDR